jgi:hypothetical protein
LNVSVLLSVSPYPLNQGTHLHSLFRTRLEHSETALRFIRKTYVSEIDLFYTVF